MLPSQQSSLRRLVLGLAAVLLLASHLALNAWVRYQHEHGTRRVRLLLVGDDSPQLAALLVDAAAEPLPSEFVGRLVALPQTAALGPGVFASARPLGPADQLDRVLHEDAVDRALFFPPHHRPEEAAALIHVCGVAGVPASFAIPLPQPTAARPRIATIGDRPFVEFEFAPKPPKPPVALVPGSALGDRSWPRVVRPAGAPPALAFSPQRAASRPGDACPADGGRAG